MITQELEIDAYFRPAYSAFLDLALPAIAVSMIWTLQLPTKKKISLTLIMSAGVL